MFDYAVILDIIGLWRSILYLFIFIFFLFIKLFFVCLVVDVWIMDDDDRYEWKSEYLLLNHKI